MPDGLTIAQQMGWYSVASMAPNGHVVVRLEFTSDLEMVDFVHVVADHVGRGVGLDDEGVHCVGVAIRECVINAIKHGNHGDAAKHVFVDFVTIARGGARELMIRVRDEGEGFDPESIADPLARDNLLKGSGRGIFLVRHFMDDVRLQRAPEGGMEIRMTKRLGPETASHDPLEG
jgi:serine/threonine-protein kinase RsbW